MDKNDWINGKIGYASIYNKKKIWDAIFYILNNLEIKRHFKWESKKLINKFIWDQIVIKIENLYKLLNV